MADGKLVAQPIEPPQGDAPALLPQPSEPLPEQTAAAVPDAAPGRLRRVWRALRRPRTLEEKTARARAIGEFARALLLFALIGAALTLLLQFTISARWVTEFVRDNKLPKDRRTLLILSMVGGGVLGALAGSTGFLIARRRGHGTDSLLRAAWFSSPLCFLFFVPILFRLKIWKDLHLWLLVATALVAFLLEGSLWRAFASTPAWISRLWAKARARTPRWLSEHAPTVVMLAGVLFYAVYMSFYMVRRHHSFLTASFDTAIQNQLMGAALEGNFLSSQVCTGHDGSSYLSNHAQFGMYAFLPIYALAPRAETLIVIESTVLALGAVPIYFFAKKRLSGWASALVALAWLMWFPMHGANFYEIQFIPIAAPFVLFTIWAADARRWVAFFAFFVLAISMREDVSIGLAVAGTFLFFSGHRPKIGLFMAVTSVIYFYVLRFHLMPAAGPWWFHDMYKSLAGPGERGFSAVIRTIITNPLFVLRHLITEKKFLYVLYLMTPLVFLPFRRRWLWLAFIPGIIPTILTTDYGPTSEIGFQYPMAWAPWLFLAVVLALASIRASSDWGRERARAAVLAMFAASSVLTYHLGAFAKSPSLRTGFSYADYKWTPEREKQLQDARALIAQIPKQASVVIGEHIGPHVPARTEMWRLENGVHDADYIITRRGDLGIGGNTRAHFRKAVASKEYGIVDRRGDIVLLKKGHDPAQNEALIREWGL